MENSHLKVFIIYARADEDLKNELLKHLIPFDRKGLLKVWNDREIKPGEQWETAILQNLREADIILPLISKDFFASEYIDNVEMREAVTRYHNGEILIFPLIVRDCAWDEDSLFSVLQVLPKDGKPVDSEYWKHRDAAWLDAVRGIQSVIPSWQERRKKVAALELKQIKNEQKTEKSQPKKKATPPLQATSKKQKTVSEKQKPEPIVAPASPQIAASPSEQASITTIQENKIEIVEPIEFSTSQVENENPVVVIDEEKFWADAIKSQNTELVAEYLRIFPEGKYKSMALPIVEKYIFEKSRKINSAVELEKSFFEKVESALTIEKCDEYLKTYPNGVFKIKVQNLKETIIKNNKISEREQFLYGEAKRLGSISSFQKYLDEYEKGGYATEIREWYELKLQEMEVNECASVLEKNQLKLLLEFQKKYWFRHSNYLNRPKNAVIETIDKVIDDKIKGLKIISESVQNTDIRMSIYFFSAYLTFWIITLVGCWSCLSMKTWSIWDWKIWTWVFPVILCGYWFLLILVGFSKIVFDWHSLPIENTMAPVKKYFQYYEKLENIKTHYVNNSIKKWRPAYLLISILLCAAYYFNSCKLLWLSDVLLVSSFFGTAFTAKWQLDRF